jgi:hypothetical protein
MAATITAWVSGLARRAPTKAELGNDLMPMLLVVSPALIGLAALIGALVMIGKPREEGEAYVGRWIGVGLLLIVSLGIGTCYAWVLSGPIGG